MDELNCAMTTTTTENSIAELVQWERFLPRMVLRVLLVEADHSTRQIIAALLRKCSYPDLSFFSRSGVIQKSIACIKRSTSSQDHIIWNQSFDSWYRFYPIQFFFLCNLSQVRVLFLFCYLHSCLRLVVFLFVFLLHSCPCSYSYSCFF